MWFVVEKSCLPFPSRTGLSHTLPSPLLLHTHHRAERLPSQGDLGRVRSQSRCRTQGFLMAFLASAAGVPLLQARRRGQQCRRDSQQRARARQGKREDQDGGEAGTLGIDSRSVWSLFLDSQLKNEVGLTFLIRFPSFPAPTKQHVPLTKGELDFLPAESLDESIVIGKFPTSFYPSFLSLP